MKINERLSLSTPSGSARNLNKISSKKNKSLNSKDTVSLSNTKYSFTEGNYVEPLENPKKIMNKIDKEISSAKKSLQVEMYRLGHDKLVNLLLDQAKRGVKVQVLLDPTPGYNPEDIADQKQIQDKLKAGGVEVLNYPIDKKGKIDHVKLLIVDGKSVIMGGMNWDKHSPENQDSDIYMRGPAVADSLDIFNNDWQLAGGAIIHDLQPPGEQADANSKVRMLTTEVDRKDIKTALQENINKAQKSIRMEAFALADKDTIKNLIAAKKRGVDVRVLLDPNKPVYFANKKAAQELKNAGISVRWFNVDVERREKLHAKLAVFDNDKTLIGSCNFSKAGLEVNHESDAEVISEAVGDAFINMFDEHWENKGLEELISLPDFYEKQDDAPVKEQFGKEIFKYFQKNFHPQKNSKFSGNRKKDILGAINEYDATLEFAPVESLGKSGQENLIDESKEAKNIGDLASFFGDIKDFNMEPPPGSNKLIYDTRVEVSATSANEVAKKVPQYVNDMIEVIQDKDIKKFVADAFKKASKGFFKAPSSSSGKFHPADEVDPNDMDISTKEYPPYPGGGLVLHSRRVQKMGELLCNHYKIQGKQKDEILAALALHDIMKGVTMEDMKNSMAQGTEIPWNDTTVPNHGPVVGEWMKMLDKSPGKKMTENIRRFASNHMGIWNEPEPTPPEVMGDFISSMADYMASRDNVYLKV